MPPRCTRLPLVCSLATSPLYPISCRRTRETRERTEFGNDAGRRGLRHPAESLESFDHRPNLRRRLPDCFVNRLLQFHDPRRHMVHFLQIIGQRSFQRRLLETHMALDPLPMFLRPGFDSIRPPPAVPQQELSQPMTRFQLVLLRRFARSHQVAQCLVGAFGYPNGTAPADPLPNSGENRPV